MLKYIILGIVQGITEFLPVSSSAHLVIVQKIFGITGQEVALTVVLHLGSALALILYFFKDIVEVLRDVKLLLFIMLVTIITGSIGILGIDFFESTFRSPQLISVALIITGVILIFSQRFMDGRRKTVSIKDAILLGLTQAIAIIPGISRSGITICSLLFRKIDREVSFKFSFLVSIILIFGANILEAREINFVLKTDGVNLMAGFGASLFSGILALWILKLVMQKAKLHYFGYYCIGIALLTLLFIK